MMLVYTRLNTVKKLFKPLISGLQPRRIGNGLNKKSGKLNRIENLWSIEECLFH